ncbi:MAG: 3-isopropylmalate dehydratase large subunit [Myxococcales bacterium]|nr:3-isopropylmalate dehydratase large subunit [Myxococcales bacterium]
MTKETSGAKTLLEKIWHEHWVTQEKDCPALLYIDLHLIHEVTSPQAFAGLRQRGLRVRRPEQTVATMDHSTPTVPRELRVLDDAAEAQLSQLRKNCEDFGIRLYAMDDSQTGIVHVLGPELGVTQPGMTIVCGDSHTATHGAFGALAFGIGTSEVEHVLATQCLLQHCPKNYLVRFNGSLRPGVSAKDMILALIAKIGVGGGTGHVFEYTGEAISSLSMEARMTICNMSIEAGARAGLIAPDDATYQYLAGREFAPKGEDWEKALDRWKKLVSDRGATYDRTIELDVSTVEPMITFGTHPGMGISISEPVPSPDDLVDLREREGLKKALQYMGLEAGKPLVNHPIDVVFIGSCTNSRIEDLRAAAQVMKGRKIAERVRTLIVPGSTHVKAQAEAEGLHTVFLEAGAEWREPGCSMCIAMNGDQIQPGQYAVSTSNRNFEGRQGKGGRTFLASPLTAAASAISGAVTDARTLMN